MLNQNKLSLKASVLMLTVLTAGIIAAFITHYIGTKVWFYVSIGLTMAAVSLMIVIYKKDRYPEEKLLPGIFLLVGLVITAAALIFNYVLPVSSGNDENMRTVAVFGGICFAVTGAVLITYPLYTDHLKKQRCTDEVMATCIMHIEKYIGKGEHSYAPVWSFWHSGAEQSVAERRYTFRPPQVGSLTLICVNPNDPEDIYRRERARKVWGFIVGIPSLMIGAFVLRIALM